MIFHKNDCIQGRYKIGDTLEADYNPKLDEMNPKVVGVYRLNLIFIFVVSISFLVYLFYLFKQL